MWKHNPHAEFVFAIITVVFTFGALFLLALDSWRVLCRYMKSRKNKGQ